MDERKVTIINEIEYWKQHKLLPEHYCNFLLALYTEGEDAKASKEQDKASLFPNMVERFQLLLLCLSLPFSFIVIYFTEFHVNLQLVILILLLIHSASLAIYYKDKRPAYFHPAFITSLFMLLMLSISVTNVWFSQPIATAMVITSNFLFWMIAGYKLKSKYIIVIGALGSIFVFLYYFLWN
ncbi:hypothetical protein [Oceanobacillus alkalisoli]|uniref:hypothetical protein n=1 Tax=Oceanobacillus alkalisoli TaxID=2925113 RepID=UPI001F11D79F|nr:hypothetical protein [Oceanobacillus alkalisoli]MCF3941790.1 hypothetical protein [Oceanobacillus alkalisoli]